MLDLHRLVLKKEKELLEVARHLGPEQVLTRSKSICESLTSKDENLREKTGKEKSKQLMARIDEKSLRIIDRESRAKTHRHVCLDTSPTNQWD